MRKGLNVFVSLGLTLATSFTSVIRVPYVEASGEKGQEDLVSTTETSFSKNEARKIKKDSGKVIGAVVENAWESSMVSYGPETPSAPSETTTVIQCSNPYTTIDPNNPSTIIDPLTVSDTGTILDLNTYVWLNHADLGDLSIYLDHGNSNDNIRLKDSQVCAGNENIDAYFDDEGSPLTCFSGNPSIQGYVQPEMPLSNFDGYNVNGTWRLEIDDDTGGNGGTLFGWCVLAEVEVAPPCEKPDPPILYEPTDGSVVNTSQPFFDWSDVAYGDSYWLAISNLNDWTNDYLAEVNESEHTLLSPRDDGDYVWYVQAHNTGDGCDVLSDPSEQRSFTIDTVAPAVPDLIAPENHAQLENDTPLFEWEGSADTQLFNLVVDDDSDFSSPIVDSYVPQSTFSPGSFSDGTYFWRVSAIDEAGNVSDWSYPWDFTIDTTVANCYTLTTSVSPSNSGSVSLSPSYNCSGGYTDGTSVQLTAYEASGYQFDHWSGNIGGSANPANIIMNGDKTITANFVSSGKPDLIVTEIGFTDFWKPFHPETIDISAKVKNIGNAPASNATVNFYLDSLNNPLGSQDISEVIGTDDDPKGTPWNISYALPNRTWEHHTIFAKVSTTDIESDTTNNITTQEVSVNYTDFKMDEDAFYFKNPRWSWDIFNVYFEKMLIEMSSDWKLSWKLLYTPSLLDAVEFVEEAGQCFGMAYTSILYQKMPETKPVPVPTFDLGIYEAIYDIRSNYMRQFFREVPKIRFLGFDSVESSYDKLKENIKNDIPPIMALGETKHTPFHAVVGYKVLTLYDSLEGRDKDIVFIYDNESPLSYLGPYTDQRIIMFDTEPDGKTVKFGQYAFWTGYESRDADMGGYIDITIPSELENASKASLTAGNSPGNSDTELFQKYTKQIIRNLYDDGRIVVLLGSDNANALILDQAGRRIGFDGGNLVNEIPGATYEIGDTSMIEIYRLPASGTYTVKVQGNADGDFGLHALIPDKNNQIQVVYHESVNTTAKSVATATISQTYTSFRLGNDLDGDGTNDETITPDFGGSIKVNNMLYLPIVTRY